MQVRAFVRASAVLLAIAAQLPLYASVVYVNKNAPGAVHDGNSWSTAFLSVQAGVNAAVSGDEVWVAASTPAAPAYVENITLGNGVALYGGFAGTETQRFQRKWVANATIIEPGQYESAVTVPSTVKQAVTVDGFTLRGGGTGVIIEGGPATIDNNIIVRNAWDGVSVGDAQASLANDIISGNGGDGVHVGGYAVITNNTITSNGEWGVELNFRSYASATIANTIVAYNRIDGILGATASALSHNDLFGNSSGNAGLSEPDAQGNISVDPKLNNKYDDIHIQPDSPCVDAGADDRAIGSTDAYGKPRIIGAHVDIGADESDGTTWPATARKIYVSPSGNDSADGLSWVTAKSTVSGALEMSRGQDEVWVAKGTYAANVTIPPGVGIYGGFAGNESSRDARALAANPTELDGNGGFIVECTFQDIVVDGFVLRNGVLGARIDSGTSKFANNVIEGNSFDGVEVEGGLATLTGNTICRNGHCGVSVGNGTAQLTNNTIIANSSDGAYVGIQARVQILNSILAFNGRYGVFWQGFYVGGLSHNDSYGNSSGEYSGITTCSIDGNVSSDPLFANRARSDWHLTAGSPCIGAGDDSWVAPGESDLDGHPRICGAHVDMGAYEFIPHPTTRVEVGSSLQAPPASLEGIVYAGGDDGKLYAFTSPSLEPVAGFPVDISTAVGTPVKLNTRPAVYYGKTGKAIYLTTNLGHVVKVWPNGKISWTAKPLTGPTMSTPAVTPDGNVYVDLGLGTDSVASFLFKLDETSGLATYVSPYLGSSPANALIDRSAAIDQRYAYVNASGDVLGSLAVLNQDNLVVRASFASGEDALAPYLTGQNIYVATRAGSVYKVNGITMSPDLAFGTLGRVKVGEGVTVGPFLDASGYAYVGTASGKVWKLDGTTGAKNLFVDSGTNSAVAGLLVTRSVLAFGTANGTLEQVSLSNSSSKSVQTLSGPPAGGPVYDSVQGRLIVATTGGQVYSIPGM